MVDMSIGRHALRKVLAESTVRQVAARIGASKSAVEDWATGRSYPLCRFRLRCLDVYRIQITDWERPWHLSAHADTAGPIMVG